MNMLKEHQKLSAVMELYVDAIREKKLNAYIIV